MGAIAVAIAIIAGGFAAIGVGIATAGAAQAVSRQPEASGKIIQIALIGMAMAEAMGILGFLMSFLLYGKL
ncbi:MAG: ATP F0F1 synthase subunit C [Bacillota bacterium]